MHSESEESVSAWISQLKSGSDSASQKLWNRYVEQLISHARWKLRSAPRQVADEEDVANDAFGNLLRGVSEGRFADLNDRDDLWQILAMLTDRKAIDRFRSATSRRKFEVGESALHRDGDIRSRDTAGPVAREPSPEFAHLAAEQLGVLLDGLDSELRCIATLKLEGYTNTEIAEQLGCSPRTVERKLARIRQTWQESDLA